MTVFSVTALVWSLGMLFAANGFQHVRGGLLLAVVIPALVVAAVTLAYWSPTAPESFFRTEILDGGGLHATTSIQSASRVVVASESFVAPSLSGQRFELALHMALFAGLVVASWAGLSTLIIALLYALPGRKWRHREAAVRLAAVQSHRDRAVLRWVAAHDKDPAVCQAAGERLALL